MSELLDIATRVAGWANDGEQVEAFVVHETETEVRAYEGEVESFTRAESQGVGVRVIVDGKQGYAYAGTLDDTSALAPVLQSWTETKQPWLELAVEIPAASKQPST